MSDESDFDLSDYWRGGPVPGCIAGVLGLVIIASVVLAAWLNAGRP